MALNHIFKKGVFIEHEQSAIQLNDKYQTKNRLKQSHEILFFLCVKYRKKNNGFEGNNR